MSGDLFAKEMSVAERAEGVLAAEDGEVPREEMEAVLKGYKKLLRQTRKLMRISDRSEAELNRVAKALDEKNAVLQDLSVKLSKYLSPQIYQSIFSGERDVSIATERKKLTVFFSDIKDFTLTTEDMQPWWEGLSEGEPAVDWHGDAYDAHAERPANAAHPNSRFTVSAQQNPSSAPDADSENIRCHPPTSLLYCANQEARALALVDEIKRCIAEGDVPLRTR